ncbi:MAG: RNA polymerase sigma factor [Bacteroidota bacterium]
MNPFSTQYDTDASDTELIQAALRGDKRSLEQLLRKHQPYIYNIAWKMVHQPSDAADLTQEALIKIITQLGKFSFKSSFRTWAYRIVVNHFLNEKKRGRERFFNSFEDMERGLDMIEDQPLSELEQAEQQAMIREMNLSCMSAMLLCLNREQRLVYIIGEVFGGDHNIGSNIMQISRDNFRAKLKKARRDLYNFMNRKCGLVNKSNPCRCHKKVRVATSSGQINAKQILFNRPEYQKFQEQIAPDAEFLFDDLDEQYALLYREMPYKADFDKQTFIEEIINSMDWSSRLGLFPS